MALIRSLHGRFVSFVFFVPFVVPWMSRVQLRLRYISRQEDDVALGEQKKEQAEATPNG